ncbi:hypothetical protein IWW50_004749 [Coemansia erecta]|nr:hypothetical protein IWW50_004749 [Coemansia erecta]
MAHPVVMSVWRPQEYEREWLLRLRTDGLQDMYEANLNLRADNHQPYARMNASSIQPTEKIGITTTDPFYDMPEYALHVDQDGQATLRAPGSYSPGENSSRYSTGSIITVDEPKKLRRIL